jgi:alpha-N-arabinofuranosidase
LTNSAGDGQPHHAQIHLHTEHRVAPVDERIFGGFLEHLGRAVYGGVYDPGSSLSDEHGFRTDVIEALRWLRMPMVRYPGGNFVSSHDWRDAVGPREHRPRRPDFAWRSIETNQFGTDEFMQWCDAVGTRPMMAVNLGTGRPADAAALVEYCNLPRGTSVADQRAANGHADPYDVELWCLGNEMDGPWQAGQVPASTYAERALVASHLMKGLDPRIKTVACGSSWNGLPTYLEWDRTVLEHCWEQIDFISVHRYSRKDPDDAAGFLAEGVVIDSILDDYRGLLTYAKSRKRSRHDVRVCFDEWNVWNRTTTAEGDWSEAPPLLEERYNLEDAVVCAQYLHSFVRNADIVTAACLAQVVNVIAPVLTRPDGLLLQSIYWPFKLLRDAVSGDALWVGVRAPELTTAGRADVPVVDAAATYDDSRGTASVSLVNRDPAAAVEVTISIAGAGFDVAGAKVLTGDAATTNDWETPDAVRPTDTNVLVDDRGALHVTLPSPSHTVITLRRRDRV